MNKELKMLAIEVEQTREEMMQIINCQGNFTDQEVVEKSQELDQLLLEYYL